MIAAIDNILQVGSATVHAMTDGVWVGAAVALAVFIFLRVNRNFNAASRHAAWCAGLAIIAILPVASFAVSLARVQVIAGDPSGAQSTTRTAQAPAAREITVSVPATSGVAGTLAASGPVAMLARIAQPVGIALAGLAIAVALARVGMLIAGLFGLAREKRRSPIVDASIVPRLAAAMRRDPGARRVDVRLSDSIGTPAAAGFRTPAVLLPAELVRDVDPEALNQIAMHEYAHLRRFDDWTNLCQRVIERLMWFNPAVWFVSGRIDLEREIACDDWAVADSTSVSTYADCLWHLARDGRVPIYAATAPGAFFTRNQIVARIEHLLERRRGEAAAVRPAKMFALAPVFAAALFFVMQSAPAIALHVDSPVVAQSSRVAVSIIKLPVTLAAAAHRPVAVRAGAAPDRETTVAIAPVGPVSAAAPSAPAGTPTRHSFVHRDLMVHMIVRVHYHLHNVERMMQAARASTVGATTSTVSAAMESVKAGQAVQLAAMAETDDGTGIQVGRNMMAHCTGCDLSGHDLRNADLHGLSLMGDNLSDADLRGANLHGSVLMGVDLSNAKLDGADLRGALLTGSDIDGASFAGAKTDGIRLVGVQLTNELMSAASARSLLEGCAGCDLSAVDLHGRDLHGITLSGADLHGMDLSNANLSGAHFNGDDFEGVNFNGADLTNATMNGCDLRGADLSNAHTRGLRMRGTLGNAMTPDGSYQ